MIFERRRGCSHAAPLVAATCSARIAPSGRGRPPDSSGSYAWSRGASALSSGQVAPRVAHLSNWRATSGCGTPITARLFPDPLHGRQTLQPSRSSDLRGCRWLPSLVAPTSHLRRRAGFAIVSKLSAAISRSSQYDDPPLHSSIHRSSSCYPAPWQSARSLHAKSFVGLHLLAARRVLDSGPPQIRWKWLSRSRMPVAISGRHRRRLLVLRLIGARFVPRSLRSIDRGRLIAHD